MNSNNSTTAVDQLRKTKAKISQSIEVLNHLNQQYKDRQQRKFISTFLHLMDKMSNQLAEAHQNYLNIDKEIQASDKCVKLKIQLNFYRTQCIQLKRELEQVDLQLTEQLQKSRELKEKKNNLSDALIKKVKQIQKYKSISANKTKYESDMNTKFESQIKSSNDNIKNRFVLTSRAKDNNFFGNQKTTQFQTTQPSVNRLRVKSRNSRVSKQKSNRTDDIETTQWNTPIVEISQTVKTFRNTSKKYELFS